MGIFKDLGVMVDGLEDDDAEEFGGDVEEIFRFDVLLTREQDIEIGVSIAELEVEGFPDFGEDYSMLAHTFAELITEHIGMYTEGLMMEVADLPELDVELTDDERAALANEDTNENGSVLLYSFPVLIMEDEDDGSKNLGAGFNRSLKADVMLKLYGEEFAQAEDSYQDLVTDAVLDHGVLFLKAVEAIQKV
ncbi:MAG: hypothetical protein E7221_06085 [Clostridiales bacterium]|nr:hypothetical protein [Clostridiales bacterium]MBQ3322449.1 hypothetical protein [Bacillota bacterium]